MLSIIAMIVQLGCYTTPEHPKGLVTLEVEPTTGEIKVVDSVEADNPVYLDWSKDGEVLYACHSRGVAAYKLDEGHYRLVDVCDLGTAICYVAVSKDGGKLSFAAYGAGFTGFVEICGGKFGKVTKFVHTGSGYDKLRQEKAHCHSCVPTPVGDSFAVCDLGLDGIYMYGYGDGKIGKISDTMPKGAGPRHVVFHPDGRHAFVGFELKNLVSAYDWSIEEGFRQINQLSTVRAETKESYVSAIRVTPDGRQVVVSNRGEQSLAVFDIEAKTGALKYKATTVIPGDWPRDFMFLTEELAILGQERSGEVHTLKYDKEMGKFEVLKTLKGFWRPVAFLKKEDKKF